MMAAEVKQLIPVANSCGPIEWRRRPADSDFAKRDLCDEFLVASTSLGRRTATGQGRYR